MNERCTGFARDVVTRGLARVDRGRAQAHGGAEPAHVALLDRRRVFRHDDPRRNPAPLRCVGKCCAMIPRRMRDDAPRRCRGVEREHGVARTARLERADALQVLALEEQRRADFGVDGSARHDRRPVHVWCDARGGAADRRQIRQIETGAGGHVSVSQGCGHGRAARPFCASTAGSAVDVGKKQVLPRLRLHLDRADLVHEVDVFHHVLWRRRVDDLGIVQHLQDAVDAALLL